MEIINQLKNLLTGTKQFIFEKRTKSLLRSCEEFVRAYEEFKCLLEIVGGVECRIVKECDSIEKKLELAYKLVEHCKKYQDVDRTYVDKTKFLEEWIGHLKSLLPEG